jgi:hypothetical protein
MGKLFTMTMGIQLTISIGHIVSDPDVGLGALKFEKGGSGPSNLDGNPIPGVLFNEREKAPGQTNGLTIVSLLVSL